MGSIVTHETKFCKGWNAMKSVICLAHSRWSSDPERTQHLMRMIQNVNVIYYEISVTNHASKCIFKKMDHESREPHPGVTVYRVPPICYHEEGNGPLEKWSLKRAVSFINARLRRHHVRDGLLWCATPLFAEYVEQIQHKGLVYDCYRSWEKYPEELESQLAFDADVVFAASENLMEHVSPCNRNAVLLPYGVNYNLYAKAAEPGIALDPVMAELPKPILGYLGTVKPGLQLSPMLKAAKEHPDWSFVIIGRVQWGHPDIERLHHYKNIYVLGRRQPSEVPGCLAACDACFDLLHNDIADEDVVRDRIYAYFAAEKPVACVYPRRYVPEFPDVIYGAHTAEEFENCCVCAANELGHRKKTIRATYAKDADWSGRAEIMNRVLRDNGLI